MRSKPIPGSTGEVLTSLPSPYLAHAPTGLLYLPRFLAKCRYVKEHGSLPASYAKNYKRGLDRFLCLHLGVDPDSWWGWGLLENWEGNTTEHYRPHNYG